VKPDLETFKQKSDTKLIGVSVMGTLMPNAEPLKDGRLPSVVHGSPSSHWLDWLHPAQSPEPSQTRPPCSLHRVSTGALG